MPCPDWDALLMRWQTLMHTYFSFPFQALLGLRNYNKLISMMRCHKSQQLLTALKQGTTSKHYTLHNGLILYKGRIFLGPSYCLIPKVLSHVHDSPLGGHSGYLISFHRLKQDFWWQSMKSDLKTYIKECVVCQ